MNKPFILMNIIINSIQLFSRARIRWTCWFVHLANVTMSNHSQLAVEFLGIDKENENSAK